MANLIRVNSEQIIDRRKGDRRINHVKFPASLMTHIIVDQQKLFNEPILPRQPLNESIKSYQNTIKAKNPRMPVGFGTQEIA